MRSFRFIVKYMRKYMGVLILTIISMLLLVGVQLLAPWIVKQMISTVTDAGIAPKDFEQITKFALLALSAYILRAGLQFVRSYMAHVAGWSVVADVRSDLYEHLQKLDIGTLSR